MTNEDTRTAYLTLATVTGEIFCARVELPATLTNDQALATFRERRSAAERATYSYMNFVRFTSPTVSLVVEWRHVTAASLRDHVNADDDMLFTVDPDELTPRRGS